MFEFSEPNIKGPIAQPSNTLTAVSYILIGGVLINQNILISLATLFLGITTIYFHSKMTILGQWLDISSIILLIIILLIKGFPFNNLDHNYFFAGVICICIGWIFWIIDIKKLSIIPKNHFLTGHGIWHLLTAISIWFMYHSLPIH